MGAIYAGLSSRNGYVFVTSDIYGDAKEENAIVRMNRLCGALIVTAKGDFLIRVKDLLEEILPKTDTVEGLSINLAETIVKLFESKFQMIPDYKENPLPFLLLLVGYGQNQPANLRHIFVRNRVVDRKVKNEGMEYVTGFDIHPLSPAKNLFYGYSELLQYLSQQLPLNDMNLHEVKLSAFYSMTETQRIDSSLNPNIRMAVLSDRDGFVWIDNNELEQLSDNIKILSKNLEVGLKKSFLN